MSRLDINIRRLQAQRACLDMAMGLVERVPGPVFELGLGNGRTYDHLREHLPEREIYVFEREVAAHPDCVPDADHLFVGDLRETLPAAARRFAGGVALVHADVGTADRTRDAHLAAFIGRWLPAVLCPGGVAVGDRDIVFKHARALSLPAGFEPGTYYMYMLPGGMAAPAVRRA